MSSVDRRPIDRIAARYCVKYSRRIYKADPTGFCSSREGLLLGIPHALVGIKNGLHGEQLVARTNDIPERLDKPRDNPEPLEETNEYDPEPPFPSPTGESKKRACGDRGIHFYEFMVGSSVRQMVLWFWEVGECGAYLNAVCSTLEECRDNVQILDPACTVLHRLISYYFQRTKVE